MIKPRTVLSKPLTGSGSLVVQVVMGLHQPTPPQPEQTALPIPKQRKGVTGRGTANASPLASSSKERVYTPNRPTLCIFVTHLVFSFLALLFPLCRCFMELLRQMPFLRLAFNSVCSMVEEWGEFSSYRNIGCITIFPRIKNNQGITLKAL